MRAMGSKPAFSKAEVYFDGACPLCRWEIDTYRKLDRAQAVDWVDVHAVSSDTDLGPDLDRTTALARFHVRTEAGDLLEGGRAFAYLWTRMPRTRWLGVVFSRPPLVWVLVAAYPVFLKVRPVLQVLVRKKTSTEA